MVNAETSRNPFLDKKQTIVILQWLIVIVTSYLTLFGRVEVTHDPRSYGLIVILLLSTLILYRLPKETFHHRSFDSVLLLFDTILISLAILMNRDVSWDLFLLYFFVLFIAAIGESMSKIVFGSVIILLVYFGLLIQQGKEVTQIGLELFIRIPFLFGVSILYGYLSENAKREKKRAETVEQRERLKMDLVAGLAHDIKTPLGVIIGHAEIMTDNLQSLEHIQKRIKDNAQRIVNLVTDFLEVNKAEVGKLELVQAPVPVNDLLREAVQYQGSDIQKKRLTLELKLDQKLPDILGDKTKLDRAFWNLISNAIKFSPHGGKINISSTHTDGHVSVAVKDTGIGIPHDELPSLFSQFRRLKGSEKIEGTGLGLFIVKTIIEAHKGTIQVESSDGQGSAFTVHLPVCS